MRTRGGRGNSRKSVLELKGDFAELKTSVRLTNKLLHEASSTRAYIHQFGIWLTGLAVLLGFYYNYLLLQPIWWTLFAVLFSYTVLSVLKNGVVYILCWFFAKSVARSSEDSSLLGSLFSLVLFALVPAGSGSRFYFGLLIRAWLALLYRSHVYEGNFELHERVVKTLLSLLMVRVGLSVSGAVARTIDKILEYFRRCTGAIVLPVANGIASAVVMLFAVALFLVVTVWVVYGFIEEFLLLYSIFSKYSAVMKTFISTLPGRVTFWEPALEAARSWAQRLDSSEALSPTTRALLRYVYELVGLAKQKQTQTFLLDQRAILLCLDRSSSSGSNSGSCSDEQLGRVNGMFGRLANASEVVLLTLEGQVEQLVKRPAVLLYALKEVVDFVQNRTTGKLWPVDHQALDEALVSSSDTVSKALWFLKDLLVHSGAWSVTALTSTTSVLSSLLWSSTSLVFDSFLQGAVYITALFLLLQSDVSVTNYTAVVLHFFDPSNALDNAVNAALRAILYSALKMALFHGLFIWLVYRWFHCSVLVIPTVLAFLLGLVPVVTPVVVLAPVLGYLYFAGETVALGATFALGFHVWWFVGPAIYAEIPDSSAWMTTCAVGFGIGLFGVRGVIVGPAVAVIPFAIYRLGVSYLKKAARLGSRETRDDESFWSQILGERTGGLFPHAAATAAATATAAAIDLDADVDVLFQQVTRRRNHRRNLSSKF